MADETTITWADLMREAKGPLVEALRFKTVLLSEVKRDSNPRRWNGKQVTIPIFVSLQQGTSTLGQQQALPAAQVVDTEQAVLQSAIVACAVSFSTQALNQAKGDENVWAEVLPTKMQRTEDAFGRVINEMMTGSGDALIAPVTTATGAASTATVNIIVGANANFYQLYVGRIVDVLVRSDGSRSAGFTVPVRITAVDFAQATPANNFITVAKTDGTSFSSAATATTDGIYISQESYFATVYPATVGTVTPSGTAQLQGIRQAVSASGVFEGINKTNVDAWRGTQASPAAQGPLTIAVLDKAERLTAQRSGRTPDFYLADPAVIDKYSQALTVQAQWAGAEGSLETGWTGVKYRNKLLVPDFDMAPSTAIGVQKEDMALYTLDDGPDWDEHTGSMFQRFGNRSLPLEAWLIWMLQFGFQACNGFVFIGTLDRAT